MARKATGTVNQRSDGSWYAVVTLEGQKRRSFDLPTCTMEAQAKGETSKAQRLDEEIMKVAAQLSGDSPIVGAGGRTA